MLKEHKNEVSAREARNNFSDTINRVQYGNERIKIQKYGKDVAAIVSLDDLQLLEELEDKLSKKAIKEAQAEQGDAPLDSLDDIKQELGLS